VNGSRVVLLDSSPDVAAYVPVALAEISEIEPPELGTLRGDK
jgi:hypothetical protein